MIPWINFDWHPETQALVSTEHGPSIFDGPAGGDEVNQRATEIIDGAVDQKVGILGVVEVLGRHLGWSLDGNQIIESVARGQPEPKDQDQPRCESAKRLER